MKKMHFRRITIVFFSIILAFTVSLGFVPEVVNGILFTSVQAAENMSVSVEGVQPGDMTYTFEKRPAIEASFRMGNEDMDMSSIRIIVDGNEVTEFSEIEFEKSAKEASVHYMPREDMSYGEHDVEIYISDNDGNVFDYSWFFVVDKDLESGFDFYFGNPHCHTSFSDGQGIPSEAYEFAYEQGLDFLVVTDHSDMFEGDEYDPEEKEYKASPDSEWTRTGEMIDDFNSSHDDFLAMRGFEMTFPHLGHLNAFNTENYVEAYTMTTLSEFYEWSENQPGAIVQFCHPKWPDTSFDSLKYDKDADRVINMIEVANGRRPYGYSRMEEYYFKALDKGWHVGAANVQDNHGRNWGETDNLTVYIGESLSEEDFCDAYRLRRVYATETKTLKMTFKGNGHWMGSVLQLEDNESLEMDIAVEDEENPISTISLISNGGKVIASWEINDIAGEWHPSVMADECDRWYVVKVVHSDGSIGFSSPIFTTGIDSTGGSSRFGDLENHWAKWEIEYMASRGFVNGVGEGCFMANDRISRAQFISILVRMAGLTAEEGNEIDFVDVHENAWYGDAVKTAVSLGIANGIDEDRFAPDSYITREQMAKMIERLMIIMDMGTDINGNEVEEVLTDITDSSQISYWAMKPVASMIQADIMKGRSDGRFDPMGNATRGESVVVLYRVLQKQMLRSVSK